MKVGARLRVINRNAVAGFEMLDQILAAHRLARFGAAEFHDPSSDGRASEIVIEADDAESFRPGNVERIRHQADGGSVDIAELILEIVQNRQRRAGRRALAVDYFLREFHIERRFGGHGDPPKGASDDAPRRTRRQIERSEGTIEISY